MFENQPKGLWALALANTGERFGYYIFAHLVALVYALALTDVFHDFKTRLPRNSVINKCNLAMV